MFKNTSSVIYAVKSSKKESGANNSFTEFEVESSVVGFHVWKPVSSHIICKLYFLEKYRVIDKNV